jgi:hypothetical protein
MFDKFLKKKKIERNNEGFFSKKRVAFFREDRFLGFLLFSLAESWLGRVSKHRYLP